MWRNSDNALVCHSMSDHRASTSPDVGPGRYKRTLVCRACGPEKNPYREYVAPSKSVEPTDGRGHARYVSKVPALFFMLEMMYTIDLAGQREDGTVGQRDDCRCESPGREP